MSVLRIVGSVLLILTAMGFSMSSQPVCANDQHQSDTNESKQATDVGSPLGQGTEKSSEKDQESDQPPPGFATLTIDVWDGGLSRLACGSSLPLIHSFPPASQHRSGPLVRNGFTVLLFESHNSNDQHAYLVCRYHNPPPSFS
jgi:hypothetical protein